MKNKNGASFQRDMIMKSISNYGTPAFIIEKNPPDIKRIVCISVNGLRKVLIDDLIEENSTNIQVQNFTEIMGRIPTEEELNYLNWIISNIFLTPNGP